MRIGFVIILTILMLLSCSGYIIQKYKIVYDSPDIYCGSSLPILIEDIDLIEEVVIETAQSFDLKKITIDEARERYFWLNSGLDIIFAYSHPMSGEFYNLIILYENLTRDRTRDITIPKYTYWIEFFSYSKYGTTTEEFLALRNKFIKNFRDKFGEGSILTEKEATPPPPPKYYPRVPLKDSLSIHSPVYYRQSMSKNFNIEY